MSKRVIILFVFAGYFLFSSFVPEKSTSFGVRIIVIDAGHGGKDPGCSGKANKEKDIALAVALKLGAYIENTFKDTRVVYTRKTDVFVELQERAEIANRNKADLFISIHCNSNEKKEPFGSETYLMGLKNERGNLDVAKRENSTILMEDNYLKKYDGFDPNSDEATIIFSMYQNIYVDLSLSLASKIQKQYKEKAGRSDKGVKRASLWVLWKTAMPSLLTEIGFLSNVEEEKFLASNEGQEKIATSLFHAFQEYKNEVEGTNTKQEPVLASKDSLLKVLMPPKATTVATKVASKEDKNLVSEKNPEKVKIKEVIEILNKDIVKQASGNNTSEINAKVVNAINKNPLPLVQGLVYKVQIASSEKKLSSSSTKLKNATIVEEYIVNGVYKYTSGAYSELNLAIKQQSDLRKMGFSDAFVVTFKDGKRIK